MNPVKCILASLYSIIASLIVVLPIGARAADDSAIFELDLLAERQKGRLDSFKRYIVDVQNDPYYGGDGRYEGYFLEELIRSGLEGKNTDTLDLQFVAKDGYRVNAKVDTLPLSKGVVAVRDLKAEEGKEWRDVKEGRETMSPAPFVLVWKGRYPDEKNLPIPHQLVKIRVLRTESAIKLAYPKNETALAGYASFKANCSSCHSLNGDGGVIGPELNVPRNVTEYWSKENIMSLLEDPANLRWGSRMPSFAHLKLEEREGIYHYLSEMKQQKVCASKEECAEYFHKAE